MSGLPLGITVMPEYIQFEGVEQVLDRVHGIAGARSVTTSPYVASEAAPGTGLREPPDDAGAGRKRLLDRPLWGKREVWMNAALSFRPDATLYDGLAYRPPDANAFTDTAGGAIGAFLDAAGGRGLETWLQVQAAIPPCHRVQFGNPTDTDHPLLPSGKAVANRVDRNATLASGDLRAYMRAFVTDLCRAYPQASGVKFDWPEYPVYAFDALFFDFNPSVAPFAARMGLNLEAIRRGMTDMLGDLSDGRIRHRNISLDTLPGFRATLFAAYPAVRDLIRLRTGIVTDYVKFLSETLDTASGGRAKMFLQCFPPPLNAVTGFDFTDAGKVSDVVGIKLYTMHWPLIEASYIAALKDRAGMKPATVARVLSRLLSLSPESERDIEAIRYPEPDEAHPASSADLTAKVTAARHSVPEGTDVVAISHGYGPKDDVLRRVRAAASAPCDAVHLNRYCYLSDKKLDALGQLAVAPA